MGVYIEGLRMPKQGRYITVTVYHDGVCKFQFGGELAGNAYEVPEKHGRLIDADAFGKGLRETIDECFKWAEEVKDGEMYARVSQSLATFVECSLRAKAAPTIIEAEGTE